MQTLNTITRWFVLSSANPSEVSLTLRGILVGFIPTLMVLAGLVHLNLGQDQLTAVFDTLAGIVQTILTIVASVMTVYGLLRKLWITIRTHQAVTTGQQ